MMDIRKILLKAFSGTEWVMSGDDYAGLTWLRRFP
jgi:hypothetical protein